MNLPAHPPHTEPPMPSRKYSRRRIVIGICVIAVLASLHFLRAAIG